MLNFYLTMFDTDEEISKFEELYKLYRQDTVVIKDNSYKFSKESHISIAESVKKID